MADSTLADRMKDEIVGVVIPPDEAVQILLQATANGTTMGNYGSS